MLRAPPDGPRSGNLGAGAVRGTIIILLLLLLLLLMIIIIMLVLILVIMIMIMGTYNKKSIVIQTNTIQHN